MEPHFSMPLVLIPVIAFAVWRRVRRQFGPQPIRRTRMILRIAILAAIAGLITLAVMHDLRLLEGLAGGVLAGAALGLLGLRLSRFEVHPVKGDCYVPNPYIGALVTALLLARLVWRFAMLGPAMQDPTGATQPLHGPGIGQSPLTLLTFGLVVGYYVCYYGGLLVHHQRIVRNRPELRDPA
ncbi:DUF1453 domain-containing protein [Dyella flagellata]|uniref:DUF1453 domain-containing protein n=1 Tax=Dyella flagellata TaxID=1867833 RepID=A0ABQ5X766_9GAMM|nr:DUF1453 domain-containing protein [Dyella flagellata]GLQ86888.1 hypothetical protein GCM10007898_04540 [Dyella flagellata]